jgi:hypothetical protein
MKRKQEVVLGVVAMVAAAVAYPVGWHIGVVKHARHDPNPLSGVSGTLSRQIHKRPESIDVTNATITDVGAVGSEEVFDLLSGANAELRQSWARQLESMPFGPKKRAAIRSFYKTLVQLDPVAATQLVVDCKDPVTREWGVRGVIAGAAPADMPDVARMLDRLGPEIRSGYIYIAIWNWSLADPRATSEYIEHHLSETQPNQAYLLVHNWTTIDPESAKAWVDRVHLNEGQRWQALKGLAGGLLERDRKTTLDYLVAQAHDPDFGVAINTVAKDSFLHAPDEARDFVLRLSDPHVQDEAIDQIAGLTDAEPMQEMRRSEETIAKWLISLPSEVWSKHIGNLEERWNYKDSDEFSGWVNQLPPQTRDVAVARFCAQVSSASLEDAIVFGQTITDPTLREETLRDAIAASDKTRSEIFELFDTLRLSPQQRVNLTGFVPDE